MLPTSITTFAMSMALQAAARGDLEGGVAVFIDLRREPGTALLAALDPEHRADPEGARRRADALARVRSTAAAWLRADDVAEKLRVLELEGASALASPAPDGSFRLALVQGDVSLLVIGLPS